MSCRYISESSIVLSFNAPGATLMSLNHRHHGDTSMRENAKLFLFSLILKLIKFHPEQWDGYLGFKPIQSVETKYLLPSKKRSLV